MTTPLLKRLCTIAAAVETTPGTPVSLAAAQGAYNAYDFEIQADIGFQNREAQGSFDYLKGATNARGGKLTFKHDLRWSGTGLPAWASVLFPMCGWVAAGQVFNPVSEAPGGASGAKAGTIGVFEDGLFKSLAGAVGRFTFNLVSGEIAFIEFEFEGVWQTPTDVALIEPTYPTDDPMRFGGATNTWQGVTMCLQEATVESGNEITLRECATTDPGLESGVIVDRQPMIKANPETRLVADDPRYTDWTCHTEGAIAISIPGPGTSTLAISAPKAQIINIQESDRNKLLVDDIEWACNKNGATKDEALTITFTDTV